MQKRLEQPLLTYFSTDYKVESSNSSFAQLMHHNHTFEEPEYLKILPYATENNTLMVRINNLQDLFDSKIKP